MAIDPVKGPGVGGGGGGGGSRLYFRSLKRCRTVSVNVKIHVLLINSIKSNKYTFL